MDEEIKDQSTTIDGEENKEAKQEEVKTPEQIRKEIEAELKKEFESDLERRIQQMSVKQKKEQEEKDRLAKMSEEERIAELQKQKEVELSAKENAIRERELGIVLRDTLVDQGLPIQLKDLFNVTAFVGKEETEFVDSIKNFKAIFDSVVEKQVEEAKAQYLKGSTPKSQSTNQKDITPYEQAKQSGNTLSMIQAKLQQS